MASNAHDERIVTSGFVVTPETIANRSFTSAFRGFDQAEVRTFLKRISEELGAAAEREAKLRRLLHEAQTRAAHPEVDEELLTNALGEHAARLLGSAREQAASMRAEAEARASRLMRDAEQQISRIRSEADSLLARRVEEVDGVSANLRNAAEADAKALREQAKADVEAELQGARSQGREMVAEARTVRERVLADLARRRHIAEIQLDQLRAARERLLDAYALVRRTLDEATQELKMAEVEARLAADQVARRAPEPPPAPPRLPATADMPSSAAGGLGPESGPGRAPAPAPAAMAVRPARPEPVTRPGEQRLRPPNRPGESRPSPPSPVRRPFADESAHARSDEPSARRDPRLPHVEPIVRRAPVVGGEPPSPLVHAPAPITSASLQPPSILPRPVPPPPARHGPPPQASPVADVGGPEVDAPPWAGSDVDRVDALFARIKADRAATAVTTGPPAPAPATAPTPAEAPAPTADEPAPGASEHATAAPVPPPTSAPPEARGAQVADEAARGRRDEVLEPIEETLARQLKRVLQDEQNEVLDRLRRKRRRHNGSPLPDTDEQVGRFREAAESVLDDAVRAGIRFADPNASEAHADEATGRQVATALARALAEPLRDRLARALEHDADDPSEAVSGVYRQWRGQEIEPLARHHATVAFSRGAFAAYAEGSGLRWVVDDDGGPCPDCDDNDLAGTVIKGQAFPTGQTHPPAHPGCRCVLVPAV